MTSSAVAASPGGRGRWSARIFGPAAPAARRLRARASNARTSPSLLSNSRYKQHPRAGADGRREWDIAATRHRVRAAERNRRPAPAARSAAGRKGWSVVIHAAEGLAARDPTGNGRASTWEGWARHEYHRDDPYLRPAGRSRLGGPRLLGRRGLPTRIPGLGQHLNSMVASHVGADYATRSDRSATGGRSPRSTATGLAVPSANWPATRTT